MGALCAVRGPPASGGRVTRGTLEEQDVAPHSVEPIPTSPSANRVVRGGGQLLLRLAAAAIAFCVLYPVLTLLWQAFTGGSGPGRAITDAFKTPNLWSATKNTIILVVASSAIAIVVGGLLAWLNERTTARMGLASDAVPVLPLLISPVAGPLGFVFLFAPGIGLVNVLLAKAPHWARVFLPDEISVYSVVGVVLVTAVYMVPVVYVLLTAALRNVDPAIEEASRMCGVGPAKTALKVLIPAMRVPLSSVLVLCLITSLSIFTTPVIIGTPSQFQTLPVLIFRQVFQAYPPRLAQAVVLSILMFVTIQLALLIEYVASTRARDRALKARPARLGLADIGRWASLGRLITVAYLVAGTVLPVIGLGYVSLQRFWSSSFTLSKADFNSYYRVLNSIAVRNAFTNSMKLAVVGAFLGLLCALILSALTRTASKSLGRIVNGVSGLPATLPHTVVGIAFIVSFGTGFFKLANSLTILLIAYVVMYLPVAVRSTNVAYASVPDDLVESSNMCGAGSAMTFRRISLPLMFGGLATGWVLLFVSMFNEVTASAFLAGPNSPVIGAYLIDLYLNVGDFPALAALSICICVVNAIVVIAVISLGKLNIRHQKP